MADAADARIARGEAGPLEGLPLGVKDLYCTEGVQTTAGSRILEGFVPAYESTVSSQLWRDGAVMLGKLNLDEFAMGSSNETSYYGPPCRRGARPGSNAALVPGGSSGGSAAAVAARLCLGATATDTGGSIRQPAAFTGTVGIKPTYGRCSRWGVVAFASSLDQAGPITRTVRDAAIMLRSDGRLRSRRTRPRSTVAVPDYEASIGASVAGKTIGIPRQYRDRRHAGRDRRALGRGGRLAEGGRRQGRRHRAAPHEIRPAGLLHRGAPPKPPRTSPATTASATGCACPAATSPRCTATRARRASARRCAAAS